jgi:hypothetical protein
MTVSLSDLRLRLGVGLSARATGLSLAQLLIAWSQFVVCSVFRADDRGAFSVDDGACGFHPRRSSPPLEHSSSSSVARPERVRRPGNLFLEDRRSGPSIRARYVTLSVGSPWASTLRQRVFVERSDVLARFAGVANR